MALALLSLGSNLGDRRGILQAALAALSTSLGIELLATSAWHETRPIGGPPGQKPFLNAAALLETSLPPAELLARMQRIELHLGRTREKRWAARTLDLDLLLYDNLAVNLPGLMLPHPRMAFRRFVLGPAVEVAPDMVHPRIGWTVRHLWEHLNASSPYVALADASGTNASRIALLIAQRVPVRLISDPQPADESAAAAEEHELARLDRWRRLLAASAWPQPATLTLSDFWFDSAVTIAARCLPPAQLARFRDAWQAARREVVQPRLVLRLDPPDVAPLPESGPWLQLEARNLEAASEEAIAAIEAMQ